MVIPANASAAHLDGDLAGLEALATLHVCHRRLRVCQPEVMVGVGEDANVGLVHGGSSSHIRVATGVYIEDKAEREEWKRKIGEQL